MTDVLSPNINPAPSEAIEFSPAPDLFELAVKEHVDRHLQSYRAFAADQEALFEVRVLPNDQLHSQIEAKLVWLLGLPITADEAEVTVETRHGIEINVFTHFVNSRKGPLAVDRVYTTSSEPPAWFSEACRQKPSPQPTMDGHCPDAGAFLLALFQD